MNKHHHYHMNMLTSMYVDTIKIPVEQGKEYRHTYHTHLFIIFISSCTLIQENTIIVMYIHTYLHTYILSCGVPVYV
jgi:hypothetical protein